jgi:hypothetical protein
MTAIRLPDYSNTNVSHAPKFDGSRVTGAYAVDADKMGNVDFTMTKQWATRAPDERFNSLDDLYTKALCYEENSRENLIDVNSVEVTPSMDLLLPYLTGGQITTTPTHLAFQQLCALANPSIPCDYVVNLALVGATGEVATALRNGLRRSAAKKISAYTMPENGVNILRSCMYNEDTRLTLAQIIRQLQRAVGNLTGLDGSDWKTPGKLNWSTIEHNPFDMAGQQSLFMSDRDMTLFFCKDANPLEAGKTRRGLPDVYFPGAIISASETQQMAIHITLMMLRGVCCNLSLRGVEGKRSLQIKHKGNATLRLERGFDVLDSPQDGAKFVRQILSIKEERIPLLSYRDSHADQDETRVQFLRKIGFTIKASEAIMSASMKHEQHPLETIYDVYQGITQHAQSLPNYSDRNAMEYAATKLLPKNI